MKFTVLLLALVGAVFAAPKVSKPLVHEIRKPSVNFTESKPSPRLIGGQEATPHSFPYQALLLSRSGGSASYCQGALISESYVLTSAYCVYGASTVEVTLGAHKAFEDEDTQIILTSTEVTIHEDYVNFENNNIAVVRLPVSVRFTPAIKTIPLPSQDDVDTYVGALTTVTSWGQTTTDGSMSDVLNFLQVRVISNPECANTWGVYPSIICTSGAGYIGACYDYGAPLVTDGVLIGINSYGAVDCSGGYPSAFTRVTSYLAWILKNTNA